MILILVKHPHAYTLKHTHQLQEMMCDFVKQHKDVSSDE